MPTHLFRALRPAVFLAASAVFCSGAVETNDETAIRQLNAAYIEAFLTCDVARYRELLSDDFRAVLADGREIDKAEFLKQSAVPPGVSHFRNRDVVARVYGEAAVVHARASYTRSDGTETQTRYVNVWIRRNGRWQVVSAQWTRVTAP